MKMILRIIVSLMLAAASAAAFAFEAPNASPWFTINLPSGVIGVQGVAITPNAKSVYVLEPGPFKTVADPSVIGYSACDRCNLGPFGDILSNDADIGHQGLGCVDSWDSQG